MESIRDKVNNFKTTYKEGFIKSEVDSLLKDYPDINMDKFYNALRGNTCMIRDGKVIMYHCDIENALKCGIENRDLYYWEWD